LLKLVTLEKFYRYLLLVVWPDLEEYANSILGKKNSLKTKLLIKNPYHSMLGKNSFGVSL